MKRLSILWILILLLSSCSPASPCQDSQNSACTRVLFLGNSYTFVNDLPAIFADLAKTGQHPVQVDSVAEGGWSLADHAQSGDTRKALHSRQWSYVVLQEQSQMPSVQQSREYSMYPAARTLVQEIRDQGAVPLFFLTWAHREGFPEQGMKDYQSMQYQINDGYYAIAQELHVPVVAVGSAWLASVKQHPEISLWQADGSHPSREGTYLAACVFYATIFQESPVGLKYRAGLPRDTAEALQTVASKTVLNIP